jgi:nucleotide-binding universal stress UspA family protein
VLIQCSDRDAGEALLSLASDLQCGLIVMGGYGHARFREFLLGGVTKAMNNAMLVPVLMCH